MLLRTPLLIALLIVRGYAIFGSSCSWMQCSDNYSAQVTEQTKPVFICLYITQAELCIENAGCTGIDFALSAFKSDLSKDYETNNCSDYVNPTPSTTTEMSSTTLVPSPPPSVICEPELPKVPNESNPIQVEELPRPITVPTDSLKNTLCAQHYYPTLRHCSIFSNSHLRPFHEETIQTCSLPGSWYLLKHPDITIEVTGVVDSIQSNITRINKVNITLHSYECTRGATISYIAMANDDLPSTFTSDHYIQVKLQDPIDFHVNQNRTVASILAPWLNLTVIVRKHDDMLGVVLRMPADIARNADGLCSTQCPSHSVHNINSFKARKCVEDANSALYACTFNADLYKILHGASRTDQISLIPIFSDICSFDVLNSLSYSVLSFMKAIAKDYRLLPDVAPDITPEPNGPVDPLPIDQIIETESQISTISTISTSSSTVIKPSNTRIPDDTSTREVKPSTTSSVTHLPATEPPSAPTNINIRPGELPSPGATLRLTRLFLLLVILPLFLLYRVM